MLLLLFFFFFVSRRVFNPDFALFQYSSINQMCMQFSANSGVANEQHLQHFHFVGRWVLFSSFYFFKYVF